MKTAIRAWTLRVAVAGTACGTLSAGAASAQTPLTARQLVDSLETVRGAAETLWRVGDARGIELLEDAWSFLDSPGVADVTRGSRQVRYRAANMGFETACAYAIQGDTASALAALKRTHEWGAPALFHSVAQRSCPDLYALRDLPGYRHVLDLWRSETRRWENTALNTPYRPELPEAERVAGLSLLWSEIRTMLPDFQTAPGLDLDSLYLAYLPRVQGHVTTFDYYRTLTRFVAELRDAHTNVYYPEELADRVYARPPLVTALIETRVLVMEVLSDALAAMGVETGMEIVEIDGIEPGRYVARAIIPFVSSSTPQDLDVRAYRYALLRGDADTRVRLTLGSADGTTRIVDLPRSGYEDIRPSRVTRDTVLADDIGYLRIDGFESRDLAEYIPAAMTRLAETRGLIIDVRFNGGGSSFYGNLILEHLTGEPFETPRSWWREYVGRYRASWPQPGTLVSTGVEWEPSPASNDYTGPVIVLISGMTFSAAEDFVATFDAMDRGLLMGEATGGSTGQPFGFSLPGGGTARVRTKHDTYPDGREFIGVGVQPDRLVRPTVAGVRAGRDEVLEAALAEMRRRLGGS